MNYLRKLLGLCQHEWEVIKMVTLVESNIRVGYIYHQQCKHCGKLKKTEMMN